MLLLKKDKWEVKKLEEILDDLYTGSSYKEVFSSLLTYSIVKPKSITNLETVFVNKENLNSINLDISKPKKVCSKGDLLIIHHSMSKRLIGLTFIYNHDSESLIDSSILVIKHKQDSKYLYFFFNSLKTQLQIRKSCEKICTQARKSYEFLVSDLKKIKISLPPLNVQRLIGNYLYRLSLLEEQLKSS